MCRSEDKSEGSRLRAGRCSLTPSETRAPAIKVATFGRRSGGSAGIVWGRETRKTFRSSRNDQSFIRNRFSLGWSLKLTTRSNLWPLTTDLFNFVATNEPIVSDVEGREGVVHPENKHEESVSLST